MLQRLAAGLATAAALAGPVHGGDAEVALEPVTYDLDWVVYLTHAPGDFSRLFALERDGRIRIINKGDELLPTPFLDITDRVEVVLESGMLGMAFHPNYQQNGRFFVHYVTSGKPYTTTIAEYQVSAENPDIADVSSEEILLSFDTAAFHVAGWIGFGPDGYLYIASGDGGDSDNAQSASDLRGKILRIDVDSTSGHRSYGIPPNNPFASAGGLPEVWLMGLRNPYRCAFDFEAGEFWMADVGSGGTQRREEINVVSLDAPTANFGWPCKEGTVCLNQPSCPCTSSMQDPLYDYQSGCAIIGGKVYRGCAIPELQGSYIYGDFCVASLFELTVLDNGEVISEPLIFAHGVLGFGKDAEGELYVCRTIGVERIVRAEPLDPDPCDAPPLGDLNGDDLVNSSDLLILLANWGPCQAGSDCDADLNDDGGVNVFDMLVLLGQWTGA